MLEHKIKKHYKTFKENKKLIYEYSTNRFLIYNQNLKGYMAIEQQYKPIKINSEIKNYLLGSY